MKYLRVEVRNGAYDPDAGMLQQMHAYGSDTRTEPWQSPTRAGLGARFLGTLSGRRRGSGSVSKHGDRREVVV